MRKEIKLNLIKNRMFYALIFMFLIGLSIPLHAQKNERKITGIVLDASSQPLIGATVVVKGTPNGSTTDFDGKFEIAVTPNAVLEVSYIGYKSKDVDVKNSTALKIVLEEDVNMLDDVVVVGYGTMKKSDVATAISSIKPDEFNVGGSANRDVRSLLEGRVAGLSVTRTGGSSPTDGVAVQLRGVTSINGGTSPLVIIDGIPGGNINLLRPDDIESIDVLKDGSAAAIYGSRASAGVIIITTKKGKEGKTVIEYSTYMGKYVKSHNPKFLSTDQYKSVMSDLGSDSSSYDRGGSSNMYDEIINKGNLSYNHSLAVSGGTAASTYRASLFYSNFEGIAKKNQRRQWGGRLSLTSKALEDMLTIQTNLSTTFDYMDRIGNEGWEAALRANPTNPIYNKDGSFYENSASDENKYARLFQQKSKRDENTTGLDSKITLEPIQDLKFSIMGSVIRNTYDDNVYYDKDSRTSYDTWNSGGYASKSHYVSTKGAVEPTIEYSKILKQKHFVTALAGYSWQIDTWNSFSAYNSQFLNDATQENDLGGGTGISTGQGKAGMSSDKQKSNLIAFFGRVNYIYDEKYIVQASYRREGSSKFGSNNKWGNFSGVSLAWNASRETFIKNIPTISNLKVRAGYGETGNSDIDPYLSMSTLGTGNPYLNDQGIWQQTYGPNKNPNPNLKWETKKEWNLGLDFGVLKNRIVGAVDVYKRKSEDLLMKNVTAPIPSNIHSTYTTNIGTISSSGIEFTINGTVIDNTDFRWDAALVASKLFKNRLDKFSNNSGDYYSTGSIGGFGALGDAVRLYEGSDVGDFYGKRFAGFDDKGEWLFYNKEGEAVPGDKIYDDDLTVIGNGVPKWNLGFTNTFKYKDFDMTIGFIGKFQFDILNRQKMAYGNLKTLSSGYNVLESALKDNINASYQYSDYYLEKGNYVKLDNVTIGYTLRRVIPSINSLRVYMSAKDLFYITSYSGESPELNDTGLSPSMASYGSSPRTMSFTLGCSVQF